MVIWAGCGQLNRFLIATVQRVLSHPGLDGLPILLLSSDCKVLARDTRATTAVVVASLCEAWRRPSVFARLRRDRQVGGYSRPNDNGTGPAFGKAPGPGQQRPSLQRK